MAWKFSALAASFVLLAVPAWAQDAMPAKCAAMVAPPLALAGWTMRPDLASASASAGLDAAALVPGHAANVALHPTRSVAYVMQPEKPGGSVAHGGLLVVPVTEAGTYQVSQDSVAWIDLIKDGALVVSTAHGPGPACTGIRKTVRFALEPGRYVLQISANADPVIAVMVSRVP